MTFDPTSVEVTCVTLLKDHCVQVLWKYIKVCGYSDPFCKNLNQRSLTPRWPLTPHLLRSHVWLYPRIIVSKSHENTSKYVDTVTFFAKKNLNQRSLTPRWPLTPHLLRSHVWLYPRIILSKSHENTSKYVDIVNLFAKNLNQRSLTPRWPLTPTSVEVTCVTVPKDHYVQVPWEYVNVCGYSYQCCKKLPHTYIHTHTTYILRTYYVHTTYYVQNQWSHSLSGETIKKNDLKLQLFVKILSRT